MTDRRGLPVHEVDISYVDGRAFVSIKGQQIDGIYKAEIHMEPGLIPLVKLWISPIDLHVSSDNADMIFNKELVQSLLDDGWTPPPATS